MRTINRRKMLATVGGSIGLAALAGCAGDENGEYPTQDIDVHINWAEGGATDAYARQVTGPAVESLGVDPAFQNIDGAGGLRGLTETYNAEPDGYTMGSIATPLLVVSALLDDPGFEVTEMEVVGGYSAGTFGIWADPDEGIESFDEVLDRYQDGEYEVLGIQDVGDPSDILARIMRDSDEYDFAWEETVGYGGSAEAGRAVAAGEVPVAIATDGGVRSFYDDDQIDAVTMLHTDGSLMYDEISNIDDYGYPENDYISRFMRGMCYPPGTDDEIRETMSEALEEATTFDEVQEWSEESGNPVDWIPPEEYNESIEDGYARIPEEVDLEELEE